ncbi:MAG TPA: hypothetical protein PLR28_03245 [Dokdonella sp.]|nr:hypothetical protein [Dokdonella sp.]
MWIAFVLAVVVFLVLAFRGLGFLGWTSAMAVILIGWRVNGVGSTGAFMVITTAAIGIAVLFGLAALRRNLVSRFVMPVFAKVLPRLGDTERIALEAGTVWRDGDLFSGMPH